MTFPSLYVFNALVGSRLTLRVVLQLLIAALAVNLAVLASMGPIVAFFSFSTTSWPFMVLLNVLVFAVSGVLGMAFLLQTLHAAAEHCPPPQLPPATSPPGNAVQRTDPQTPAGAAGGRSPARWTRWRATCWAGT